MNVIHQSSAFLQTVATARVGLGARPFRVKSGLRTVSKPRPVCAAKPTFLASRLMSVMCQ